MNNLPNCVAEEQRLFRENDTPYTELINKAEETLSIAQSMKPDWSEFDVNHYNEWAKLQMIKKNK